MYDEKYIDVGVLGKSTELWEILVPTARNDGTPFKTRHHREWDRQVRQISGGLTIFKPAKGQWINVLGTLIEDRVIPVRIACCRNDIHRIVDITIRHYAQDAVMAYRVSDEVVIKHAGS